MKIQNYGDSGNERRKDLRGYHPPACTCYQCNEKRLREEARDVRTGRAGRQETPREQNRQRPRSGSARGDRKDARVFRNWLLLFVVIGIGTLAILYCSTSVLSASLDDNGNFAAPNNSHASDAEVPADPPEPTLLTKPTPTPTAVPTATPNPSAAYPNGSILDPSLIEDWVYVFTNQERVAHGLAPLERDGRIADIARAHSGQMVLHGMHHVIGGLDPTDRALSAGYDCRTYHDDGSYSYGLGENIHEYSRIGSWLGKIRESIGSNANTEWEPVVYSDDSKDFGQKARRRLDAESWA